MTDDKSPQSDQCTPADKTKASTPPPSVPQSIVSVEHHDIEPTHENRPPTQEASPSRDPIRLTDWIIAIFTIVIAVAAILQWMEMNNGGKQTDRIIAADERLARTMELSVRQAQAAFSATVQQSELNQRAWIYVATHPGTPEHFQAGKPFDIRVTTKNAGRTPAMKVKSVTMISIIPQKMYPDLLLPRSKQLYNSKDYVLSGVIEPDSAIYADRTYNLGTEGVQEIDQSKSRVYVHGRVEYDDVFGKHHWITFCQYLLPGGDFAICQQHNEVDQIVP